MKPDKEMIPSFSLWSFILGYMTLGVILEAINWFGMYTK